MDTYTIGTRGRDHATGWRGPLLDAAEDAARKAADDGTLTPDEAQAVLDAAETVRAATERKEAAARRKLARETRQTAPADEADPFATGRRVADDFEPF